MNTDYIRVLADESAAFLASLERSPLLVRVIGGDADRAEYVRFLRTSYHYVRWSGHLLAKTADGMRRSKRCPELLAVLDAKAREEGPHDTWLLRDLRRCGVNTELVKGEPSPRAVQAYVAWSLTLAEAGSPAFLGAAYTLEFISMWRASLAAKNLRGRQAIPNIDQALRFLDGHGEADHGHIADLEAVLQVVTDETDQDEIVFSANVMRRLFLRFFAAEAGEVEKCCA